MKVDMRVVDNDNIVHTLTFNPDLQELIDKMIVVRRVPYNCTCEHCEESRGYNADL